jgi:SAM-dependent methyltransferase
MPASLWQPPRFDDGRQRDHNPGMAAPPAIFDHALLDARRRRALAAGSGADFLYRLAADDLVERLAAVNRRFPIAVEIGSPLPLVGERLLASGKVDAVVRLDRLAESGADLIADPEALPFAPASIDLAVSLLWLQWTHDLPGVLAQLRAALRPDGLLLAALVGGESLRELRTAFAAAEAEIAHGASPRVAPLTDVRSMGALLQRAGFALPVVDYDRHTVRYASALALMKDLRAMGAGNVLLERSRRPLARRILARAVEIYAERFAGADGRVSATFDIVWLSGWAPHAGQQRPLRPGSAAHRLADALGAVERPAGEKARP